MTEKKNEKPTLATYISYGLLAFYLIIIIIIRLRVPDAETIVAIITELYRTYGYAIVFLSGIIESLFLIGLYFPGSTAILLGAVVARTGAVSLPLIIGFGTIGILLGYIINYFMGMYGWYHVLSRFGIEQGLTEAEVKLKKHGFKAIALGYISPNTGSLISTAAGVTKMPFRKFLLLSALSQLFWSSFWGGIAYLLGTFFIELFLQYFTYIVWLIIGIWLLRAYVFKKKN